MIAMVSYLFDMTRRLTGLMCVGLFGSCGAPRFSPRIGRGPLDVAELVKRSDAVVVGTIGPIAVARKPRIGDCSALIRVSVSLENVLRGHVPGRTLEYYNFSPWCGFVGPVDIPHSGERSVLFLREDSGHWRTIEDYWSNRLRVFSGGHPDSMVENQPIEEAIARILLTPGDGDSSEDFAVGVMQGSGIAVMLVGDDGALPLLEPLLAHPDFSVRVASCAELNSIKQPEGTWACANAIVPEFLDQFSRGRLPWGTSHAPPFLELVASHAEPSIRARAEEAFPALRAFLARPGPPELKLPRGLR